MSHSGSCMCVILSLRQQLIPFLLTSRVIPENLGILLEESFPLTGVDICLLGLTTVVLSSMSSPKTDTVCGPCFLSNKNGLPAKLSKSQCKNRNEVICKTCRKKLEFYKRSIFSSDNTWHQIRLRPNKYKLQIFPRML